MRINVDYIETGAVPVLVNNQEPASRVIDRLRRLDDSTFEKSVKAAKVLRIVDKGVKWIEGKMYGGRR